MDAVLEVKKLGKTFRKPFTGKTVEAVKEVSLSVARGEIFGFLGPNGAGKTTTIKMLTGLISMSRGSATILGFPVPHPEAMGRVGFLPENPYVYPYLTPREFVSLCGELNGLRGAALQDRVRSSLERTGVAYAMDRSVRALSKGMLQRVGLAAALVHDPELLILDEPMSGLDPVGRKEVRDLIVDERAGGRTVFFSSHVLSDVEMICDRVCILRKGEVVVAGAIRDLLKQDVRRFEVAIDGLSDEVTKSIQTGGEGPAPARRVGAMTHLDIEGEDALGIALKKILDAGGRIESVTPKRETLEDIFVRKAL
jgi:ABC-2 type transport system ATP-binding protein